MYEGSPGHGGAAPCSGIKEVVVHSDGATVHEQEDQGPTKIL